MTSKLLTAANCPAFLIYVLFLTIPTFSQLNRSSEPDIYNQRGKFVVLRIPAKLVGFEKVGWWDGNLTYGTIIEASDNGGLLVGGLKEWRLAGWPLMRQLTIEKVSRDKNFTVVELRDPLFNVKLRLSNSIPNLDAAFRELVSFGTLSQFEVSEYYKMEVVEKVLPKIFPGNLASIPTARKLKLLELLRYVDTAINIEKYKGQNYLTINLGGDVYVYNSIRLDQQARIGDSLNARVLSYFKRMARAVRFHSEIDGIKIVILVPFKNFVTETYNQPNYDRVEIYAPMDAIQQFSDDELTNQEFVEESILLVNGNRVQIPIIKST